MSSKAVIMVLLNFVFVTVIVRYPKHINMKDIYMFRIPNVKIPQEFSDMFSVIQVMVAFFVYFCIY